MKKIRDYLIYYSLKYNGDYQKVKRAIIDREDMTDEEFPPIKSGVVTFDDEDYPDYLKRINDPPLVLYYYGDISLLKNIDKHVGVIGSRNFSEYGKEATENIVSGIAKDTVIVSGLAYGIDAIAHACAINNKGKTIAVLGSGIDVCYPPENQELYEKIKKNHLVISEYPGLTQPSPDKFPFRNRIIAQLSKCVLITEAYARSGTSITANFALMLGRTVCCVPYPVGKNSFCNKFINQGAFLVEGPEDVLELIDINKNEPIFEL